MDKKEDNKKARAMGDGEEREKGSCIILKKGEVLSMNVFEEDLKKCEKKEERKLRDLVREIKGGQGNEES